MILHNATSYHRQVVSQNSNYAVTVTRTSPAQLAVATGYFQNIADTGLDTVLASLHRLQDETASDKGWILVLGPTHALTKQLLEKYQIETQRVLLINPKQITHYDNLMRDALTCTTCAAVLSFLPKEHAALSDYQYLANKYQTKLCNHSKQTSSPYMM